MVSGLFSRETSCSHVLYTRSTCLVGTCMLCGVLVTARQTTGQSRTAEIFKLRCGYQIPAIAHRSRYQAIERVNHHIRFSPLAVSVPRMSPAPLDMQLTMQSVSGPVFGPRLPPRPVSRWLNCQIATSAPRSQRIPHARFAAAFPKSA